MGGDDVDGRGGGTGNLLECMYNLCAKRAMVKPDACVRRTLWALRRCPKNRVMMRMLTTTRPATHWHDRSPVLRVQILRPGDPIEKARCEEVA
jgi:hypothetical protein